MLRSPTEGRATFRPVQGDILSFPPRASDILANLLRLLSRRRSRVDDEVHGRTIAPCALLGLKHNHERKFGVSLSGESQDRPIAQTLMINSQIGVMESGPVCPVAVVCGCRLLLQALVSEIVHLANQSVNHRFESF